MDNQSNNLLYLFVGAVVAGIATLIANLIVEVYKTKQQNKVNRNTLRLMLRLEFSASLKFLNELKSSLDDRNQFLFRWTGVLRNSISALEGYKNSGFLLQDNDLQEDFTALITDLSLFVSDTEGIEQFGINSRKDTEKSEKDKKEDVEFVEKQRQSKLIELVDMKRRLEEIIKRLT